ncbi:YceI family protein [Pedobacter aquatilis]|uniref:YceI family protein n=1 Tax=Pedobacter aquatilis TaxID=351343 RepID=UPI00293163F3|nr:YceI family protein [Pedobacter aquatilis]
MNKLKQIICLLAFTAIFSNPFSLHAQNYVASDVKANLFSSTPVEDIKAQSNKTNAVIISKTGEVAFQLPIKSFEFEKKLMQEHFNENYMESDKYPTATFKGTLENNINWAKDGEYTVNAKGTLTVHGVSKARTIPGKITIKNGLVSIYTSFDVACTDHNIEIPTLVFAKIAKVINVKISGNLNPKN